jgi:glycosyltransferase involved in cell wall biosynthesis
VTPPKITIITPSFNQVGFIEKTLTSILDQGYPRLEYIVVDGGSTDGSVDVIERYASRLAWWVSEPDDGQTDALNKGLVRATGDIVAYVNSDDYLRPGALAVVAEAFARSDRSWVAGACRFETADGTLDHVWRPVMPHGRRFSWMLQPWSVPQPASFWRRDLFDRYGLFRTDMHYVFDTEFMLRLAYANELPELLPHRELAVRVLHDEAKSADTSHFRREAVRLDALFRPTLPRRQRVAARLGRGAIRLGFYQ